MEIVNDILYPSLSAIVFDYLWHNVYGHYDFGVLGLWEACANMSNSHINHCLLTGACRGGHLELVKFMVTKGNVDWPLAMEHACRGGDIQCVSYLADKECVHWDYFLGIACNMKFYHLVGILIDRGAKKCVVCELSARCHLMGEAKALSSMIAPQLR